MKKDITPEFLWHLNSVVLTFQIAIVTTIDDGGCTNAVPFGLVFPFCSSPENPQMLLCSNNMWHTARNIESTKEFVINYAPCSLIEKVALTGVMYSAGVNELDKAGLTAIPARKVNPPRIEECFQHIECRLNRIIRPSESQNNMIGDVLSISVNEELLNKGREAILKTADPLLLFGMDITRLQGHYAGVGSVTVYAPPETELE